MFPNPRHEPYLVPRLEVERRVSALQTAMRVHDVALVWLDHLPDRLYFSGSAQDGVLLIPAVAPPVFRVRKSLQRAEAEASVRVEAYAGGRALVEEALDLAGAGGRTGLALDVTRALTYSRLAGSLGAGRLLDVTSMVRSLRSVKSAWEIEQIRRASDQVTILLGEIAPYLKPGTVELELSGRIEGRLRALGHGGTVRVRAPGSDIAMGVVVSGASALYPTSFDGPVGAESPYPCTPSSAGWKRLLAGESVMLDLVTSHNGYHADTTRTFFLGARAPDRARQAHDFCCDMLRAIEERLRPGNRCSEIYSEVLRLAGERGEPEGFMGFGENRVRFFGHGVGLELDELPVLAEKVDVRLEPGMVLAVEPKAFLDGLGPVGIENTYVVGPSGAESLCDVDLSLQALPL